MRYLHTFKGFHPQQGHPTRSSAVLTPSSTQGGGDSNATVTLVPSGDVEGCDKAIADMKRRCAGGKLVVVDSTNPSAVNANAELYAKHQLNSIMGTTSGDRYRTPPPWT